MNQQYIRTCTDCGIEIEKERRNRRESRTKRCQPCYHKRRTTPIEERFFSKVVKTPTCWLWTGKKHTFGYGLFFTHKINGKSRQHSAHRFSWCVHNGNIPDGLCVLHKCDNPPCVNPDHLFLGTKKDNSVDMATKGRAKKTHFSNAQLETAINMYATGKFTHKSLATFFGVKHTPTLFRAVKKYIHSRVPTVSRASTK